MNTVAPNQRLLRLDEVAHRCDCSVSSLRRAIHRGDLVAVRLGPTERHPIRVPEAALEEWIYGNQLSAVGTSSSSVDTAPAECRETALAAVELPAARGA